MFESLSQRFSDTFRNLSGRGRITEDNIRESMREVRTALLEADVHLDVVKQFCDDVVDEALGAEVLRSLKPSEQMVGIVHDKLVELMAGDEDPADRGIMIVEPGPTIIMMCGLQGSGKTTTCGKLAAYLKTRGKSVMIAAADLQRPAAVEQLEITTNQVAEQAKGHARVLFYGEPDKCAEYGKATGVAVDVCRRALAEARKEKIDVLILDTAGRLHINDELMGELESVSRAVNPHQVFLIVDAMVGQDAVNSARAFHERFSVDGVILTKFDSDTRGGAALSVRQVTGAPIRFVGVGEKFDALEEFHAERMAGRILGMGDVVSLVEKAQEEVDEAEAERLAEQMAKGRMTMDDFVKQLRTIRRMGPMKQLLGMIPGIGPMLKNVDVDDKQFDRIEGMVNSMTKAEREDTKSLTKSRAKRIAKGSGTSISDVNRLTKQVEMMRKMTKQLAGKGLLGRMKAAKDMGNMDPATLAEMGAAGAGMPGMPGMPGFGKGNSTKTQSHRSKFKQRKKRK